MPVANHANLSLPRGGAIRTSPKAAWETPGAPLEGDPARGCSALRYPARSQDPRAFPSLDGTADLTCYPWTPRHEEFAVGLEARGHRLGWTAVTRPEEGDLSGPGILTLIPDGLAEVRHVIGAVSWPSGEPVVGLREEDHAIEVRGEGGATRRVPFRAGFPGAG